MQRSAQPAARALVALAMAASPLIAPLPARAQQTHDHGTTGTASAPAHDGTAPDDGAAQDARLERLVDAMTTATGEARLAAMAAVLSELVAQHRARHQTMPVAPAATPAGGATATPDAPRATPRGPGMMMQGGGTACPCPMMQGNHAHTGPQP